MTHTPGLWTMHRDEGTTPRYTIAAARVDGQMRTRYEAELIADTRGGLTDVARANARLIAAAPELLALVERLAWLYETEQRDGLHMRVSHDDGQHARALLARIESDV